MNKYLFLLSALPFALTAQHSKRIALIGEYDAQLPSHQATMASIDHANQFLGSSIAAEWIPTLKITPDLYRFFDGIWITPGYAHKAPNKSMWAIQYAREHNIPCLGTCRGFQHIIIEYARNVLGYQDAQHAEYNPDASTLFITTQACSLAGKKMPLSLTLDSSIAKIYGACGATENYYCTFGINPNVAHLFEKGALEIVGTDSSEEARIVSIENHPFFVGTLFVPQTRSTERKPHPIIVEFLKAIINSKTRTP